MTKKMEVSAVVFREDLYPRFELNAAVVQQYADQGIDVLPPIEVNQKNELIDGRHRWTAHQKVGAEMIDVHVTETRSDSHLLELAIERNASHGQQLSLRDKKKCARDIYHATPQGERGAKKVRLAEILSVTERTISNWLSRIDKDDKEERDAAIINMWLACYTETQIAEAIGCSRDVV